MKKVIIQSERDDRTTDDVINWIDYISSLKDTILFYDEYSVSEISLDISNNSYSFQINKNNFDERTSFWYRRGEYKYQFSNLPLFSNYFNANEVYGGGIKPIIDHLNGNILPQAINAFKDNYALKLDMLLFAKEVGFMIPHSKVISDKKILKDFYNEKEQIITKPIGYPVVSFKSKDIKISSPTIIVDDEMLDKAPNLFLPSWFQEYIEKKIEIRTFFLNGQTWSMAIFSQSNEKTKVDFRNYDHENPNRYVPYKLPIQVNKKVIEFMVKMNLNSGSLDFILTPTNQYVFLEVNPIGQFQWLSRNCNYYIEKQIAETLLNDEK